MLHVGEHAVHVEQQRFRRQYGFECRDETLKGQGLARQRDAQRRRQARAVGEVPHIDAERRERGFEERRAIPAFRQKEVCLGGRRIDAEGRQMRAQCAALLTHARHVSAQQGVAAREVPQRERDRWSGDRIRSSRGPQLRDDLATADRVANPASREPPGFGERAEDDDVGQV